MLAGNLVSGEGKRSYLRSALYLGGIAFLIWLFSYFIWIESIWDQMEDSSEALILLVFGIAWGVGASMLLAWRLAGKKKLAALILAMIFAVSFVFAQQMGQSKTWYSLTSDRASEIDHAIEKFQARNGRYPESLSELTPWYILTVPRSFMYRDLSWCYQGGKDFYRFGYIYRPIAYAPPEWIEIRIQGSAGTLPEGCWACEEELKEKRAIAPSD